MSPAGGTNLATMVYQEMSINSPIRLWNNLHHFSFNFNRVFFTGEPHSPTESTDVSVYHQSRFPKSNPKHHVRGLSTDPSHCSQLIPVAGHFPVMISNQCLRQLQNRLSLASKKTCERMKVSISEAFACAIFAGVSYFLNKSGVTRLTRSSVH